MAEASRKSALLIMDYQEEIVQLVPEPQRARTLANTAALLARARQVGMPVFWIVVKFREGYPEVNPRNKTFSGIKAAGRLVDGTPGAMIHPQVAPQAHEQVVVKRRVSGFFNTELDTLLGARGVEQIVLAGLFTSGVVLSSLRWAADRDYGIIVAADACADADDEVHQFLLRKIFPRQATVADTIALLELPEFS